MHLPDTVETTITLASLRQIQAAIAHFEKGEYECAVTLAAAGEGMLPHPSDDSTYIFGVLRHRDDETTQFNLVINSLKHGKDYKSATIDQFEAALIIARGISKFIAAHRKSHPTFEKFMDWGRDVGHFPWYPEIVPVLNEAGEVVLHDIYIHASTERTWIGSRRTQAQCIEAFNAHKRSRKA
jgi:hypothetical protein